MNGSTLTAVRAPTSGLRREWASFTVVGLLLLALVGLFEPRSLAGSLPVWGFCSWVLFRGLSSNYREGDGAFFETLGAASLVTMLRALLIALTAGFLLVPWLAAPLYTAAALLDSVDGRLARRQKRTTKLGSRLDMEVDAIGILVASLAGVSLGKLPLWYVAIGIARYLFVLGAGWRERRGRPVRALDPSPLRRLLAGCQMGFLSAALWPAIPADVSRWAALLFGGATLATFARDWLYVATSPPRKRSIRPMDSCQPG